jgi:hypothetical protein
MGARLLQLKYCFQNLQLEGNLDKNLNEVQWTVLENLVAVLKPFMIAQRVLEGQDYVAISLVPLLSTRSGMLFWHLLMALIIQLS